MRTNSAQGKSARSTLVPFRTNFLGQPNLERERKNLDGICRSFLLVKKGLDLYCSSGTHAYYYMRVSAGRHPLLRWLARTWLSARGGGRQVESDM